MIDLNNYFQLITETESMLYSYLPTGAISNLKFYLKNMIKRLLKRGYNKKDAFNWPAGLLLKGLTDAVDVLESEEYVKYSQIMDNTDYSSKDSNKRIVNEIIDCIESYLAPHLKYIFKSENTNKTFDITSPTYNERLRINVLDDAITGETLLWLYERTGKSEYKIAADAIFSFLVKHEKDIVGSLIYRPVQGNSYILADMVGMVCPFLAKYGIMFSSAEALALCEIQMINFIKYGIDTKSKLPYHGFEVANLDTTSDFRHVNYGIIGWGRAVGWILRGESLYLKVLSANNIENVSENYMKIKANFIDLCDTILKYKKESNMFSWQLQATNGPTDTSGTAMIYDAILEVENVDCIKANTSIKEILNILHTEVKLSIWEYIKDGKITNVLAECLGFSMYPQIYGSYPWGQGVTLSMLSHFI